MSQELQDFEDPILSKLQNESRIKQIVNSKTYDHLMLGVIITGTMISYLYLHKYCFETPNLNAAIFYCAMFLFCSVMLAGFKTLTYIDKKCAKSEVENENK